MNNQYAGLFGHYGPSLSESYNLRVVEANKVIDEYNQNVYSFETCDEQMEYQKKMYDKSIKILTLK